MTSNEFEYPKEIETTGFENMDLFLYPPLWDCPGPLVYYTQWKELKVGTSLKSFLPLLFTSVKLDDPHIYIFRAQYHPQHHNFTTSKLHVSNYIQKNSIVQKLSNILLSMDSVFTSSSTPRKARKWIKTHLSPSRYSPVISDSPTPSSPGIPRSKLQRFKSLLRGSQLGSCSCDELGKDECQRLRQSSISKRGIHYTSHFHLVHR